MYAKVFKIGYTKRKKIPVLFQLSDFESRTIWCDVFFLVNHIFDNTMRTYSEKPKLSTLLAYAHCTFIKQTVSHHTSAVAHAFYPKSQVNDSGKYYIYPNPKHGILRFSKK